MRRLVRIVAAVGAGIASAIAVAILLAILDLYLTGHGRPSLNRRWIEWAGAGLSLGRADVVMLLVAVLAGLAAWGVTGQRDGPRAE